MYERNLEKVVGRLEKTGARLGVGRHHARAAGHKDGGRGARRHRRTNKIAARVMQKHHIVIDDLYGWMLRDVAQFQNPHDVHFGAPGYARLAQRIVHVIETALPAAPGVNTAVVPTGSLEVDSYSWEARHAAVMAVKAQLKPEYVLIGDSITHFWGGPPTAGKRATAARSRGSRSSARIPP